MRFLARTLLVFATVLTVVGQGMPVYACGNIFDIACNVGKAIEKGAQDVGKAVEQAAKNIGGGNSIVSSRAFLGPHNYPPELYGAYGSSQPFLKKLRTQSKSRHFACM